MKYIFIMTTVIQKILMFYGKKYFSKVFNIFLKHRYIEIYYRHDHERIFYKYRHL